MAAPQGRRARHCVLHEFWPGAALAIALGAMLPGCTARFGFMEPVIVEQPRVFLVPRVVEKIKEVKVEEDVEKIYPK